MTAGKPPSVKQLKNQKALKIYAAVLCGFIVAVVAARRLRTICNKALSAQSTGKFQDSACRAILLLFRNLERRTTWTWLDRPPFGLVSVFGLFLAANAVLCFNVIAGRQMNFLASRFGWMATANMALCVLFALRSSPMVFLKTVSHAQLNRLHIVMGYFAACLAILHAIFYSVYFIRGGRWETLIETTNLEGMAAAVAMTVLLLGYLRHKNYEAFYISHIAGFVAVVVLTGLHRPDWAKKLPVVMSFIAVMWLLDRMVRAVGVVRNMVNNEVAIYPLPDDGARLLLKRPGAGAALPGTYCYLWIPSISIYQSHPFTIVSNGPRGLELVVKPRQGFTRTLCDAAAQQPGSVRWASMQGPYDSLPDTTAYEKVLLVAGGSGAALTFGIVNRILNHSHYAGEPSIDFVWAVRHADQLGWFREHLDIAAAEPSINVRVYVTEDGAPDVDGSVVAGWDKTQQGSPPCAFADTPETGERQGLLSRSPCHTMNYGGTCEYRKVEIDEVLLESMRGMACEEKVLMVVCGPTSMMAALRDAVETYQEKHGNSSIDLFCEAFSN